MNEYEIGKDIGELKAKVASIESKLAVLKENKCGKNIEELAVLESYGTDMIAEKAVDWKKFTWNRRDVGDCEIRKESVTIYSDGRYRDIAELHNHGNVYGDTFKVWMSVMAGDTAVANWRWTEYVDHGDDETKDKSGSDSGISTHWKEISSMRRRFACD